MMNKKHRSQPTKNNYDVLYKESPVLNIKKKICVKYHLAVWQQIRP
jgi:hypothetical protein